MPLLPFLFLGEAGKGGFSVVVDVILGIRFSVVVVVVILRGGFSVVVVIF